MADEGWFHGLDAGDLEGAAERIQSGSAESPRAWPEQAVETGFVPDTDAYFDRLGKASRLAVERAVAERAGADDRQVIHAVRAIDDLDRISNELAERVAEWARTTDLAGGESLDDVAALADAESTTESERAVVALAELVADAQERRSKLVEQADRRMHAIAPNLSALAGPLLGARLIALAGGLEDLAKLSSSTVQVLGAEEALFAHLRGEGPSPKHGIIYTHPAVRGTDPDRRGSAARALAGKLTIAARIDHYAGDRRPELERELDERIRRIQEGPT